MYLILSEHSTVDCSINSSNYTLLAWFCYLNDDGLVSLV